MFFTMAMLETSRPSPNPPCSSLNFTLIGSCSMPDATGVCETPDGGVAIAVPGVRLLVTNRAIRTRAEQIKTVTIGRLMLCVVARTGLSSLFLIFIFLTPFTYCLSCFGYACRPVTQCGGGCRFAAPTATVLCGRPAGCRLAKLQRLLKLPTSG